MPADVSGQDRFYRRGLVLGFTMAEIVILIIFALLLALAWEIATQKKEIASLNDDLKASESEVVVLMEQRRLIEEKVTNGDDFGDFFRELELTKARFAESEANLTALQEKVEGLEAEKQHLQERMAAAEAVVEALGDAGVAAEEPQAIAEEVVERFGRLERLESMMSEAGYGDPEGTVEALMERLEKAERLAERREGQMSNLQRELQNRGGSGLPSCWASPETGKAEYIFSTALTSEGIIVRDNALPHRREHQAELPLETMVFEDEISPGIFLSMTAPLFAWSEEEGCRFYVGVYDLTGPEEKRIYKQRLLTVQGRFFHYEYKDETFARLQ